KELISSQYAHVAENAVLDRSLLKEKLAAALPGNGELQAWLDEYSGKLESAQDFERVFQKYCWDINSNKDIQIAPFHVLAHSDRTFFDKPHEWHMEMNRQLASGSDVF